MPTTWAAVDKQVQQAAPQTRLLVARVTGGGCKTVHAVDATTPAPLGSAFKLYVLDALARAIAAGTVSWDQRLTLTSQLTSLPSGELSTEPAGTQVTVLQAAEDMISSSDNTAADLLITLVGRTAVESAAAAREWRTPPWTRRSSPPGSCSSSSSTTGPPSPAATSRSAPRAGRPC